MCAASRAARIILHEKSIKFHSINEPIWKRRIEFLKLNPEGELPVVLDDQKNKIIGYFSLAYFLEDNLLEKDLVGDNRFDRLEVRRICKWFDYKFTKEVNANIVEERVFKNLKGLGQPSTECLKAGRINLKNHENYFEWILKNRTFLAGEFFSLADIIYSAHLSTLDYLGEINWERIHLTKKWYAKIKSRPSFREILKEKLFTIPASKNYQNLDF
jgi:glutathione S-transferase